MHMRYAKYRCTHAQHIRTLINTRRKFTWQTHIFFDSMCIRYLQISDDKYIYQYQLIN